MSAANVAPAEEEQLRRRHGDHLTGATHVRGALGGEEGVGHLQ
jgi:hypothetical protein